MRECDDAAMRRARVFVDTRAGATQEGGDIVQAMKAGVLTAEDIAGDLLELTRGERSGRRYYDQITVFKSVGPAVEDLAARPEEHRVGRECVSTCRSRWS